MAVVLMPLFPLATLAQSKRYDRDRATGLNPLYHWDPQVVFSIDSTKRVHWRRTYHRSLDGRDSVLESEAEYDRSGKRVLHIRYAAPGDGGWIEIDSLRYDELGRESGRISLRARDGKIDTFEYHYRYNDSGWLIRSEAIWQRRFGYLDSHSIETYGSSATHYRMSAAPNADSVFYGADEAQPEWLTVHYPRLGERDSSQRFFLGQWQSTQIWERDTANHTRTVYYRHAGGRKLEYRETYNRDGLPISFFDPDAWNWSNRKRHRLEIRLDYGPDGGLREASYFIHGVKQYTKVYHYQYYAH